MEDKEINDAALENVTGGVETSQNDMPSMKCPRCGGIIPTSIKELLTAEYLICPHCSLKIEIAKQRPID